MIKRRHALALGLAAPGAVALASCGPNASHGDGGSGSSALRLTWWGNPTRDDMTQRVVDAYVEKDPSVSISTEPGEWSGYWDKLATQAAAGDLPDIVQMDEKYLAEYGGHGALLDLREAGLDTSTFGPGAVETGELAGEGLVGVNAGMNAFGILANPAVFEAAGVEMPDDTSWTWDEFIDIAVEISGSTDDGTFGAQQIGLNETTFHLFVRQLGQDRFQGGAIGFDADAATKYFEVIRSIQESGAGPDAALAVEDSSLSLDQSRFATGRAALTVAMSNQSLAYNDAVPGGVRLLRPPSMTGSAADVGLWYKASMYWSISAGVEDPDAALSFVDFLVNSVEAGEILSVERGVPPNLEVREAISPALDEANMMAVEYLEAIESELGTAPELTPPGGGELESIVIRVGEDVLFNRMSPAEAGQRMVEDMAAALS